MMNKWIKQGLIFLCSGCLLFAAAGCSHVDTVKEKAQGVADQVLGDTDQEAEKEKEKEEAAQEPEVDVAKPEFTANLSGSVTYKIGDTAKELTVEAKTSDEGTITYQWYKSSTNKNGGGTPIEGATENTYVPSTKEEGTTYYYVVATSTIGNSSNGVTSDTAEVIVSSAEDGQEGEGQAADNEEQGNETEDKQDDAQENQG